jgi:surfactin family lipopeptide synthetase C
MTFLSIQASKKAFISHPLSPMQKEMLYASIHFPSEYGIYILRTLIKHQDVLDIQSFLEAWKQLFEYHDNLRSQFIWQGIEAPEQQIVSNFDFIYKIFDWRGKSTDEQKILLKNAIEKDRNSGFDLSKAPLMTLVIIQLRDDDFRFLWSIHHLLADGRSRVNLLNEIYSRYNAIIRNELFIPSQAYPFIKYINWLQNCSSMDGEKFWRKKVGDFSSPIKFPFAINPLLRNKETETILYESPYIQENIKTTQDLTQKVNSFAIQHGITVNTIIQGAWSLLLNRYTCEEDILFGAIKSVRNSPAVTSDSIGLFINTVPVRIKVKQNDLLIKWLKNIRNSWIELRPFEYIAQSSIHKLSALSKKEQLFETIIMFESQSIQESLCKTNKTWNKHNVQLYSRSPVEIMLSVHGGTKISFNLEYSKLRFNPTYMKNVLPHLMTAIENIVSNNTSYVREIQILSSKDFIHLDTILRPQTTAPPPSYLIHQHFEKVVLQYPDRTAMEYQNKVFTYHQLNNLVNILASKINTLEKHHSKSIIICLPRGPEQIISILATLKAGMAFTIIDHEQAIEREHDIINDVNPDVLIISEEFQGIFIINHKKIIIFEHLHLEQSLPDKIENPVNSSSPSDAAYIMFTSGSTGKSKGVVIEHHSLSVFIENAKELYGIKPYDRVLQMATLSFDIAIEEIFVTLLSGATLVLQTEKTESIIVFLEKCKKLNITIFDLATAFWHLIVSELQADQFPPSVRLVIVGGESVHREKVQLWRKKIGQRVRLLNTYGPTETTVVVSQYDLTRHPLDLLEIPIGLPIPHVQFYILDEHHHQVPPGVEGQLFIGGAQVARGYLNRPDLTKKNFIATKSLSFAKISAENRLYSTGDKVLLDKRNLLQFRGRIDNQIKIRGFRVEPGEIESVIVQNENIQHAAVTIREMESQGKIIVAYIVPAKKNRQNQKIKQELRLWLKKKLPYYMHPVHYYCLSSLPMTINRKIDYPNLPSIEDQTIKADLQKKQMAVQHNLYEADIILLFSELLGIEGISVEDSFFDLGGNSLLVIQLIDRIKRVFKRNIPLETVYQASTPRKLSETIESFENLEPDIQLVKIHSHGNKVPFFCVHGDDANFYLPKYLDEEQPFYAFFHQGRDGHLMHHKSIPDIASHYITQLHQIQRHGPYKLGGFSIGGLIAYEMANQLTKNGEKVSLLVLFDTHAPKHKEYVISAQSSLINTNNKYNKMENVILESTNKFIQGFAKKKGRLIKMLQYYYYLLTNQLIPTELRRFYIIKTYKNAEKKYSPDKFSGSLHIFRAKENMIPDYSLGWKNLVDGKISVQEILGDHYSIMTKPHIKSLGRKLQKLLLN